jgi:7-cyano-7-deazaguanine reductase
MDINLDSSELGKKSAYAKQYNPKLLFPIPRSIKRKEIGIDINNPGFNGMDIWTNYEISWLNLKGKPIVAIGEIQYPASSKNIIESKSMKLYFNSFNNTKFINNEQLIKTVEKDISEAIENIASFKLITLNQEFNIQKISNKLCLDELDIECDTYIPNSDFLYCENNELVEEKLYSNLLKSNCLVTNQPDWGTIFIEYSGSKINHINLLKYIISLRNHNEFHEQCIERIFHDIKNKCRPNELTVYARYTRRGGLDINPYRTTKQNIQIENIRLIRQ